MQTTITATWGGIIRDVRYPAIDGIRWYAAALIFFVHASGPVTGLLQKIPEIQHTAPSDIGVRISDFIHRGQHGVDVFFLISGFLMGRIIAARGERFSYPEFLRSRFVRIYPAFLASLLICVAYFPQQYGWRFTPYDFLGNLVFLNALPSLNVFGYNYVSWSLGFEFAFYLIIPLVVLFRRFPAKYVAGAALALALLFIGPPVLRMQGLFVGFFISARSDDELKKIAARIPLWPALIAYASIVMLYRSEVLDFGYTFYWLFLAAASILFIKVVFNDNFLNRLFRSTAMRVLGTISYSVYLLHPVCISIAHAHILPLFSPHLLSAWVAVFIFLSASAALTLVASFVSWYLFERPYFAGRTHPKVADQAKAGSITPMEEATAVNSETSFASPVASASI